eukprot:15078834-Heterocapsa_arctica.AAC.1
MPLYALASAMTRYNFESNSVEIPILFSCIAYRQCAEASPTVSWVQVVNYGSPPLQTEDHRGPHR